MDWHVIFTPNVDDGSNSLGVFQYFSYSCSFDSNYINIELTGFKFKQIKRLKSSPRSNREVYHACIMCILGIKFGWYGIYLLHLMQLLIIISTHGQIKEERHSNPVRLLKDLLHPHHECPLSNERSSRFLIFNHQGLGWGWRPPHPYHLG